MFRVDSYPAAQPLQTHFPSAYIPFNASDPSLLPTPSLASPSFPSSTNSFATPLTPQAEATEGGFPFSRPAIAAYGSNQAQLDFSPAQSYTGKALPIYNEQEMIEVTQAGPMEGPERTAIVVRVNATFPPSLNPSGMMSDNAVPTKTLRVLFGQIPIQTKVGGNAQPMRTQDGGEYYEGLTMYANAPPPQTTGCVPPGAIPDRINAPVYVQVLDAQGNVLETAQVGHFQYGPDRSANSVYGSPHANLSHGSLSAKQSTDHLVSGRSSPGPIRTLSATIMRKQPSEPAMAGQSPNMHSHDHSMHRPAYGGPGRYASSPAMEFSPHNSPMSANYNQYADSQDSWGNHGGGSGVPNPPQPHPIQQAEGSSQVYQHEISSSSSVSLSQSQVQATPPMASLSQPSLLRTSQLSSNGGGFNPYVAGNAKAKLELQQDLNLMAVGWNNEEWVAKRRLVQFWRRQEGSTIHAAFRSISQSEYIPNSIVISCIYREDKNECFVTSVDAIYLLEALVGVRFSVEEKNRIRRNLEGFRPITVSKSKAGAEDFFKLVMGFPNPKPRNIEKDVKVFPWSIFGTALKKIIGKYSASYVLPQSANMGPPQPPPPERAASPAPAPYTIPAPLMPADGSMSGYNQAPPFGSPAQYHQSHPNQQQHLASPMSSSPYGQPQKNPYDFEVNDVFLAPSTSQTQLQGSLPPTPAASAAYLGSSSSGSIPTIAHPSPVTSSSGSASNGSGMIPLVHGNHSQHDVMDPRVSPVHHNSYQLGRQVSGSPMHGSYDGQGGMYR